MLNTKEQLREIDAEYQKSYKKSAVKDIKGDTSGYVVYHLPSSRFLISILFFVGGTRKPFLLSSIS